MQAKLEVPVGSEASLLPRSLDAPATGPICVMRTALGAWYAKIPLPIPAGTGGACYLLPLMIAAHLWKLLGFLAQAVKQRIDPLNQRKFGAAPEFAYHT